MIEKIAGMAGVVAILGLILLGHSIYSPKEIRTVHNPGDYWNYSVKPPCGLNLANGTLRGFDDPEVFSSRLHPEAEHVWFTSGYLAYNFSGLKNAKRLVISCEISSEAPISNSNYPSNITFYVNGVKIGVYRAPGDPGGPGKRGKLTPKWWPDYHYQWGWLVVWEVNRDGVYLNGEKVSNLTIESLNISSLNVLNISAGKHGVNIYGDRFGNYPQDIEIVVYG